MLSALYSGHLIIYNWEEQLSVKTIEVCPNIVIRCAKFIPQKEWVICGSDDFSIRVFNYHTTEKIKQFEAHTDFIRHIAVHPSLPLVLSASDDTTVRLWDWTADWARVASFEGHGHYVMMCQWNPKDPHIFATASLDRSIKIWGTQSTVAGASWNKFLSSSPTGLVLQPHFSLLGHEGGVNCLEYATSGDKPYIVSGSDDSTVRVWDYQTKQCVTVLSGHTKPVVSASFHPYLPIILSGGEDTLVNVWHATTYRLESSLNYAMGRVWRVSSDHLSNAVALATDEGTVVIQLGSEKPVASMQGGKIVMAKATEIQTVNVRLTDESLFSDGERLPLSVKDMGACEVFPQTISHHPNGRLIAVCGDGEYVVYTAQALRNKAYGKAVDFVWSSEGHYAVRSDTGVVTLFHHFKEHKSINLPFHVEELFGGRLVGVRGVDFICFYDWNDFRLVRRIDVHPHGVYWKESGTAVVLACQDSFFVLEYNENAVAQAWSNNPEPTADEDGVQEAFELEREISERLESGVWVADCFAFTTSRLRLQTLISGLLDTTAFLDRPAWLLGYLPETNRLYLIDRQLSVISYKLHLSLIQYQTAICRRDFDTATQIFKEIPVSLHNKVAKFLEAQGHQQTALEVTKDLDHKFELARSLGNLELCANVIREAQQAAAARSGETPYHFRAGATTATGGVPVPHSDGALYRTQWKQLGDLALERGLIPLSVACFQEAQDVNGLLLIYSSIGDAKGLKATADLAAKLGKANVAVMAYLLLKDVDNCIKTLVVANRVPEAALFARTYAPSRLPAVTKLWKAKLREAKHEAVADALADPEKNPDLFSGLNEAIEKEKLFRQGIQQAQHQQSTEPVSMDIDTAASSLSLETESPRPETRNAHQQSSLNTASQRESLAPSSNASDSNNFTASFTSSVESVPDFQLLNAAKSVDLMTVAPASTTEARFSEPPTAARVEGTSLPIDLLEEPAPLDDDDVCATIQSDFVVQNDSAVMSPLFATATKPSLDDLPDATLDTDGPPFIELL